GKASAHLVEVLDQALVRDRPIHRRVLVRLGGRLFGELCDVVRPLGLWAGALAGHRLDAIADHRPAVGADGPFDYPLVVVDEEPRGNEVREALLQAIELDGAADRVSGAAAEHALVVHRGTLRPKIR